MAKIFVISPVRNITTEEFAAIEKYIAKRQAGGDKVYWPFHNTDQNDPIGVRICEDNRRAIKWADEIHIWWNPKSTGSYFDLGMAFMAGKKIVPINCRQIRRTAGKSFNNVIRELAKRSKKR